MSDLQKHILKSRLPPIAPSLSKRAVARKNRDFSPTPWSKYFLKKDIVAVSDTENFCVYSSRSSPLEPEHPVICLLHGGGFSALTWSLFTTNVVKMVHCEVVALDLRGHGGTQTSNDEDLSAETLAHDVSRVLNLLYPNLPVLLIGHSMGGAIAVHVAHLGLVPNLAGVAVIDVVEGTAMEALTSMQSFLRSRPKQFQTLESAIEWCVRTGQVRNLESAKVSMPGQLKIAETGQEAITEVGVDDKSTACDVAINPENCILEEDENDVAKSSNHFKTPQPPTTALGLPTYKYTWRIDLAKTETYWPGWFSGLSTKFLNLAVPRLLLLAGIDRLDKELTVGQIQGRFQMQVLPQCGHTVQEDLPDRVAEIIATFLVRHKLATTAGSFERSFPAC